MNLQNEQKQESSLERSAEIREPRERATEMLREGDRHVSGAKGLIESARTFMKKIGMGREAELKQLEDETDAAWDELASTVEPIAKGKNIEAPTDDIDAGWETAEKPTEEELDWGMPVEIPKEASFEAMNEDEIMDAVNEAIASTFSGDATAKRHLLSMLEHPKTMEVAERFLQDELGTKTNALLKTNLNTAAFRSVHELASKRPGLQEAFKGQIAEQVGRIVAEKFMQDPSYLERIATLDASLSQELAPGGPQLMKERSLKNLAAVYETVGEHAVAFSNALDLKSLSPQLEYDTTRSVIEIDTADVDNDTGELLTKVNFNLQYTDRSESREKAGINRNIFRGLRTTESGESVPRTYVEHTEFSLPESVKDAGIAADVTRRSLELYGKEGMNLDEIKLHANIDAGGYAWASYGYGWDRQAMANSHLEKAAHEKRTIKVNGRELSLQMELTNEEQVELMREEIRNLIQRCANTLGSIQRDMKLRGSAYPDDAAASIRKAYEEALANPDITPQHLALIGDSAPKLYKGTDGQYYLEDEWPAAQMQNIAAAPGFNKPTHIGKIAMLGTEWYGTIELQQNGTQQGKNLELLKRTIARRGHIKTSS
jgi:hypothetical protein